MLGIIIDEIQFLWITGKRGVDEEKSSLNSSRAVCMCLFDIQMSK